MKTTYLKNSLSALAFVGFTALIAVFVDTYSEKPIESAPELFFDNQQILERAYQEVVKKPFEVEEVSPRKIRIYDQNNVLLDDFLLESDVELQSLIFKRRAHYLSEFNNIAIYRIAD